MQERTCLNREGVVITNKIWSSPEWKKKHAEFIKGKKCEWCGAEKSLVVHHTKRSIQYRQIMYQDALRLLAEKIKQGEYKLETRKRSVCPECKGSRIYTRIKARPLYRCNGCSNEFDKPLEIEEETNRISRGDWNAFYSKYKTDNAGKAKQYAKASNKYYLSFEDCVVLCNKCHFSLHRGLILCKSCKKHYHSSHYQMCSECDPNSARKQMNKLYEKVEVRVPCGEIITVENGELEIGGIFNICLDHCPKGQDINSCSDFGKWYEEDMRTQSQNNEDEEETEY